MSPIPANASRRDDLLLLRRGHRHALADAEGRRPRARRGARRPRARRRARPHLRRRRPPAAAQQGAELAVPAGRRRPDARLAVALLHQARHRQAAALRQQVRAVGGHRPAGGLVGRGHRRGGAGGRSRPCWRCPRSARCRPTPAPPRRSTSTASCAIPTCAPCPSRATSRSTSCRRASATAPATPSRSTSASGSPALAVPPGTSLKVVEPPPGPPVLATLLAEIYGPDPDTRRAVAAQGRGRLPLGAVHRRRRQFLWPARPAAARHHLHRRRRVLPRRGARRLRHHRHPQRRRDRRLFAPRRRPPADPDPHRAPGRRPHPRRALPDHADPGQRAARRPRRGRARRRRPRRGRARLLPDLPPQRSPRRDGDRRTRRRLRGAALRHARGARRARRPGLDRPAEARDQAPRPARGRKPADAALGWRMGGHLGDVPRHGRRLRRGAPRHLHPGRRPVRLVQACRWSS